MNSETRQEFVRAAVSYLQNPQITDSCLKDKLRFLKDKGLSELEIDEALNLAIINRSQSQQGRWNFLLILGLCFGGYRLYQAYLDSKEQHKTEGQKQQEGKEQKKAAKQSSTEQLTLTDISEKLSELKNLIERQKSQLDTDLLRTMLIGPKSMVPETTSSPEWVNNHGVGDSKES